MSLQNIASSAPVSVERLMAQRAAASGKLTILRKVAEEAGPEKNAGGKRPVASGAAIRDMGNKAGKK